MRADAARSRQRASGRKPHAWANRRMRIPAAWARCKSRCRDCSRRAHARRRTGWAARRERRCRPAARVRRSAHQAEATAPRARTIQQAQTAYRRCGAGCAGSKSERAAHRAASCAVAAERPPTPRADGAPPAATEFHRRRREAPQCAQYTTPLRVLQAGKLRQPRTANSGAMARQPRSGRGSGARNARRRVAEHGGTRAERARQGRRLAQPGRHNRWATAEGPHVSAGGASWQRTARRPRGERRSGRRTLGSAAGSRHAQRAWRQALVLQRLDWRRLVEYNTA